MDSEDVMEAVAALNEVVARADAVADKCRGMIMDLYSVPLGEDEERKIGQHWRRKYPGIKPMKWVGNFSSHVMKPKRVG